MVGVFWDFVLFEQLSQPYDIYNLEFVGWIIESAELYLIADFYKMTPSILENTIKCLVCNSDFYT